MLGQDWTSFDRVFVFPMESKNVFLTNDNRFMLFVFACAEFSVRGECERCVNV
jgi:hypothetical protein